MVLVVLYCPELVFPVTLNWWSQVCRFPNGLDNDYHNAHLHNGDTIDKHKTGDCSHNATWRWCFRKFVWFFCQLFSCLKHISFCWVEASIPSKEVALFWVNSYCLQRVQSRYKIFHCHFFLQLFNSLCTTLAIFLMSMAKSTRDR